MSFTKRHIKCKSRADKDCVLAAVVKTTRDTCLEVKVSNGYTEPKKVSSKFTFYVKDYLAIGGIKLRATFQNMVNKNKFSYIYSQKKDKVCNNKNQVV